MSTLQLLTSRLAAAPDAELLWLLARRPDLMDPPVADFSALAARASSRLGVARALDRLNLPQLQLLTALFVVADPLQGATAGQLAAAVAGATEEQLAPWLAELCALALVVPVQSPVVQSPPVPSRTTDDAGPAHFLPVASLREVLGAHPAGLGRSYAELAASVPGCRERLAMAAGRTAAAHGDPPDPATWDPAAALHDAVTACPSPAALLAGAPEGTAELLAQFRHVPMGSVAHAFRDAEARQEGSRQTGSRQAGSTQEEARLAGSTRQAGSRQEGSRQTGGIQGHPAAEAIDWLTARGLLVPLDGGHVELPAEVGLLLRNGQVIPGFAPTPPALEVPEIRLSVRDNAAMGSVAAVLRTMNSLLESVAGNPLATLRAGGVGVRAVRQLARDLGIDVAQSYFYLELAALAKLIKLNPDTSQWHAVADGWLARDRAAQWVWLAAAWLDSDRMPSLVGTSQPVVNVLSGEAFRSDAPMLRGSTLQVLETLCTAAGTAAEDAAGPPADGAGPAPAGTSPTSRANVPSPRGDQVLAHFGWHHPRPARRVAKALAGFLSEAELLGLSGAGALTDHGRAIVHRDWDGALALVAAALPEPVEHLLLQGDLTAVAPGFLAPDLAAELALLADPEGRGAAGVYRFSAASIQRAFSAGRTAEGILSFLAQHSATPVPQPLEYLLRDAQSRHGRFTVGQAGTFLTAADAAALAELLAGGAAAALELTAISPTAAVSPRSPAEVVSALREAGHSPGIAPGTPLAAGSDDGGTRRGTTSGAPRSRDRAAQSGPEMLAPHEVARLLAEEADETFEGGAGPDADSGAATAAVVLASAAEAAAAAQLGLLRSRPAWTPGTGESAPALALEQLHAAVRGKQAVWLTAVGSDGHPERRQLFPVSVAGGRVRVFDPGSGRERAIGIHRVMGVEIIAKRKGAP
ncbi:helicase-associated domain-containing protein [Arthrobacter sp. A2-55]|uniref:helicase-associated domain-containing protein n=1 Tax=Arthrobacter sp. A2-55 TaxID=2897337 RepID=UPI0021CDB4FE|nr:helicase-associated domain-containing protein [Arthrobacter sp. A2-55]MCU6480850.1 helicase-associated domain-containing protein [Arthrobacter sp. A2-55]